MVTYWYDNKNDDFVVFSFLKHVENIVLTIVPKREEGSDISSVRSVMLPVVGYRWLQWPPFPAQELFDADSKLRFFGYILILDDGSVEHQQLAIRDFLLISAQPHAVTWVVRRRGTGTWIKGKTHFVMMHFANHATAPAEVEAGPATEAAGAAGGTGFTFRRYSANSKVTSASVSASHPNWLSQIQITLYVHLQYCSYGAFIFYVDRGYEGRGVPNVFTGK